MYDISLIKRFNQYKYNRGGTVLKVFGQLFKLSLHYWKNHSKRIITFAIVIILGTAALCMATLFIRSEKQNELNKELTYFGNYDTAFLSMNKNDLKIIQNCNKLSSYGYYNELGYGGVTDGKQYKVASFPDEKSEQLFHMTCIKGRYPKAEDEIAIDLKTAKDLGVIPYPGKKVTLKLWNLEHKELVTKEYQISGIYELSNSGAESGYTRFQYIPDKVEYDRPLMFVTNENAKYFSSNTITSFIQTNDNVSKTIDELMAAGLAEPNSILDPSYGRTYSYAYVLGAIYNKDSIDNVSDINNTVDKGNIHRDFYSSILIPLFSLLILVVVVLSVFSLVRNLLHDRAEEIAILRSIGMTKYTSVIYLFTELMVISGIFIVIGLLVSSGLHYVIILFMNHIWNLNLPLGFQVNTYVGAVTASPYQYSFIVLILSCAVACVVPLLKMNKLTPVAMFQKHLYIQKSNKRNHSTDFSKSSWRSVINKHLKFHDISAMVITIIVISTVFFGFNYFKAYSELENIEYKGSLEENGLIDSDFTVTKSKNISPYEFCIENHHEDGIKVKAYTEFAKKDYIDTSFARILNNSTRLSYSVEGDSDLSKLFSNSDLRRHPVSKDKFDNALHEAEESMINAIGYKSSESVYSMPSIGIMDNELNKLKSFVKIGKIDPQKIREGKEVVLIVPAAMQELALKTLKVGEALPLSDVVLSQKEESYYFNNLRQEDFPKPVFKQMITYPDTGNKIPLTSYAFGHRKNINVKIGAIVVLDDDNMLQKYSVLNDNKTEEEPSYEISLVCLPETFSHWELPDKLFTEAKFKLKSDASIGTANEDWYEIMGQCSGISYNSVSEIKDEMKRNAGSVMAVYYLMIMLLVIVGMITIAIKFYSKIKMKNQTIARLRATGMSLGQLEKIIISQNLIYPVIGAIVAMIPTSICQQFFNYIKYCIDSGKWQGSGIYTSEAAIPWYHNIPFRYNLFDYHPVITIIVIVIAFLCLMLLATIPQIIYMRKQVIAENIDNDTF